jgi:cytochrome c oxidase cbb3-type subunit 3
MCAERRAVAGRFASMAALGVIACVVASGCKREQRQFREAPPAVTTHDVQVSDLRPGGGSPTAPVHTPYENNAYAINEGKRLYSAYNCVGCHAHGGGGIGPALRDDQWAYGHEADQIFHTILEGRPNGMPAFRGKIPDAQIWQLAAYVRSMSGLVPKDVAPNRDDHMSGPPPESSTTRQQPKNSSLPPSAVR